MKLVKGMLAGDIGRLSRLISLVEKDDPEVPQIMKEIYPRMGRAYCIGITGPPGSGKSTIINRLTTIARKKGLTVGIIAVDPTSLFTGGAVLGDRIRMQQHYLDEDVFIRSMATHGNQGGLSRSVRGVIRLLDAFGKDLILVETVGVGQTEIDIMDSVDTVVVVLVPEAGDAVQAMKAGLMEIADLFVVNKADREGADSLITTIKATLDMSLKRSEWQVPVLATQGIKNLGIEELCKHMEGHREFLESTGKLTSQRKKQRRDELVQTVKQEIGGRFLMLMQNEERLVAIAEKVERGGLDPYSAALKILNDQALLGKLAISGHHSG